MEAHVGGFSSVNQQREEELLGVRKGPWTAEEDSLLTNYVAIHGEGRWNSVARSAGQYHIYIYITLRFSLDLISCS